MLNNSNYIFKLQERYKNAETIKITGIIKVKEGIVSPILKGSVGYTSALTKWYINSINNSDIVLEQLNNPNIDVFSGKEFVTEQNIKLSQEDKLNKINSYLSSLNDNTKLKILKDIYATPSEKEVQDAYDAIDVNDLKNKIAEFLCMIGTYKTVDEAISFIDSIGAEKAKNYFKPYILPTIEENIYNERLNDLSEKSKEEQKLYILEYISGADKDKIDFIYKKFILSESSLKENLELLGSVDLAEPSSISLYAKDFNGKEEVSRIIKEEYNAKFENEEDKISYTDYADLMLKGVSTIINTVRNVLIGFVSIALVVSSIMIGIITYISVLERTKEIGVLRAIGASKRDISRVFAAETIIEGLASGVIGILFTVLICIPINLILHAITGISTLKAELPVFDAIILVVISVLLTLLAGFFPSRVAAKKDPVEALRTE
jgi:putative ABC transport system permease protein